MKDNNRVTNGNQDSFSLLWRCRNVFQIKSEPHMFYYSLSKIWYTYIDLKLQHFPSIPVAEQFPDFNNLKEHPFFDMDVYGRWNL